MCPPELWPTTSCSARPNSSHHHICRSPLYRPSLLPPAYTPAGTLSGGRFNRSDPAHTRIDRRDVEVGERNPRGLLQCDDRARAANVIGCYVSRLFAHVTATRLTRRHGEIAQPRLWTRTIPPNLPLDMSKVRSISVLGSKPCLRYCRRLSSTVSVIAHGPTPLTKESEYASITQRFFAAFRRGRHGHGASRTSRLRRQSRTHCRASPRAQNQKC